MSSVTSYTPKTATVAALDGGNLPPCCESQPSSAPSLRPLARQPLPVSVTPIHLCTAPEDLGTVLMHLGVGGEVVQPVRVQESVQVLPITYHDPERPRVREAVGTRVTVIQTRLEVLV